MRMVSVKEKIMNKVKSKGREQSVFARGEFACLGPRATVTRALTQLVAEGKLRKVGRGLYDVPSYNWLIKREPPVSLEQVVRTLEKRDRSRLMPDGFVAANALGLTTAVPAEIAYLTDGSSRTVRIGNRSIKLKRVSGKWMHWHDRIGRDVVLALRWLGSRQVDDHVVKKLKTLPQEIKADLTEGIDAMPQWMARVVEQVAYAE